MTALIGELSGPQRGSRSTVQAFCQSVLGVPISRGAIQRAVDRVSEAIKPHYEAIAQKARSTEVNYMDETAWYQHGGLAWLWPHWSAWLDAQSDGERLRPPPARAILHQGAPLPAPGRYVHQR